MENYLIVILILLPFLILVVPSKLRFYLTLAITLINITVTTLPAFSVLIIPGNGSMNYTLTGPLGQLVFTLDSLSAFFILITNFTVFTGLLYSKGYLKSYQTEKSATQLALHNFSYVWLHLSMLGVLLFRDGLSFLIVWELMAVSSFMLILFDAEKRSTLKTAVNYLVQMHIGFVLLLIAFLICEAGTGKMSFDSLSLYFSNHSNTGLFMIFFSGFAIKAGFVPFHTWLPEAHPAAPSHVSGVMSGVMIKMGIYGIVRVLTYIQTDLYLIGLIILFISIISGLWGVLMAIMQHDLKKLLAYHSIENIGIIGIGIGIGVIGLAVKNPLLALLGFSGGLLHILNHSLFKSLLFFSAGSVYKAFHTRNIEELGGVIKRMPQTAAFFLIGAIAICGLPPLNGFISELLIYYGLLQGIPSGSFYQSIYMMAALISLVFIGGLAIFCFTKAFGVVFLGSSRSALKADARETPPVMLFPQYMIITLMLLIGLFSPVFLQPLFLMTGQQFHLDPQMVSTFSPIHTMKLISLACFIFIAIIALFFLIRYLLTRKKRPRFEPTWGCGYSVPSTRQQYTGTSYANNLRELTKPVLQSHQEYEHIEPGDIFPKNHSFELHTKDVLNSVINRLIDAIMLALKKIARLQTGNIQHYILYAFLFIILLLTLLFLNWV